LIKNNLEIKIHSNISKKFSFKYGLKFAFMGYDIKPGVNVG
jgi:hypothetical protein